VCVWTAFICTVFKTFQQIIVTGVRSDKPARNRARLIIWSHKTFYEAVIELHAVLVVAPSCWKHNEPAVQNLLILKELKHYDTIF